MWKWIVSLLQDLQRGLIAHLIVLSGFGGIALAKLKVFGEFAHDLMNGKTRLDLALVLMALFYVLGRLNEKSKWKSKEEKMKILEVGLKQIGEFKWKVVHYSNGHFDINQLPYCKTHEMKLIGNWPIYFCPVSNDCPTIADELITIAWDQANSIIEAQLRNKK